MTPSIVLADDDQVFRETLQRELLREFPELRSASSGAECVALVQESEPDVLLLDLNMGDADGLDVLAEVREKFPSVEVIIVTAFGTVDAAVDAMRLGAFDFVTKPFKFETLTSAIRRAAERRGLKRENVGLRRMLRRAAPEELVGDSDAMTEIRSSIERVAGSEAPVLIVGPSGCGKEVVARAIHARSPRSERGMVTVNCASLQANLLDSELFGHERGAFTGATEQRPGLFESAHGNTLFLDEIGELPAGLQAKLLRAIQFGEIRRVGGTSTLKVDVRVLAATNRDLEQAVEEKAFREDLYYRLNVLTIRVPPLSEHAADVGPLFRFFAERAGLGYALTDEHLAVLRGYAWPGNVRELENLVERLKIHELDGPPAPRDLRALLQPRRTAPRAAVRPLEEIEREAIEQALAHFEGDRKAAAEALGIGLRTLYYRIKHYTAPDA